MKKAILMILFMFLASEGFAQRTEFFKIGGTLDPGTTIQDRAYADATLDTSRTLRVTGYKENFVTVSTKDSGSIHIKYQTSIDGTNWGVLTTIDSISTASNAGDVKSVNVSTTVVLGVPFVRFIFDVQTFRLGTSTPTYSAAYTQK